MQVNLRRQKNMPNDFRKGCWFRVCVCVFLKSQACTYQGLLFPRLDVFSLGFGEMVPNLLVTGCHEQSLNLTDYRAHEQIYIYMYIVNIHSSIVTNFVNSPTGDNIVLPVATQKFSFLCVRIM